MDIKIDLSDTGLKPEAIEEKKEKADKALEELWSDKEPLTGWVKLPLYHDWDELETLLTVSDFIREQCDLLIVIGIGGSYLGAKAAIEALPKESAGIEVAFAGTNLSADYHAGLLLKMRNRDVCLCVISKSGDTMETAAVYPVFKKALIEKYGKEPAKKRIYTVTGPARGGLRQETDREGYLNFVIPENVGGRYSVFTPAGLLPSAVAGADVRDLLRGGEAMASSPAWDFDAAGYAIARYLFLKQGQKVEIFQHYEPQMQYFVEWAKQLFGESEGKEGTGLFPAGMNLTADLHSLGQFVQEGSRIFFETVICFEKSGPDLTVPEGPMKGKTLNQLNKAAETAVRKAHRNAGIPMVKIQAPELTAFYYGQLLYFFETTCAITAKLMGVNPFDQPGVEAYKKEMKNEIS